MSTEYFHIGKRPLVAWSVVPEPKVGGDTPQVDPISVGIRWQPLIGEQTFELRVQAEGAISPLVEGHLSSPDGAQPLGGLTRDRQWQLSCPQ
jgi:hypothetical protein